MAEVKSTIRKIIDELETLLNSEDQKEPEQPKPLLTGPCVAKTRTGDLVPVYRGNRDGYCFQYLIESVCQTVSEDGKYRSDKHDHLCDITEVIRPLTEKEVLDWQFRGIEPELRVASEPVAKGFENSDVGRKEAEALGLVYLGKATIYSEYFGGFALFTFSESRNTWQKKALSVFHAGNYYAYKPAT